MGSTVVSLILFPVVDMGHTVIYKIPYLVLLGSSRGGWCILTNRFIPCGLLSTIFFWSYCLFVCFFVWSVSLGAVWLFVVKLRRQVFSSTRFNQCLFMSNSILDEDTCSHMMHILDQLLTFSENYLLIPSPFGRSVLRLSFDNQTRRKV